MINQYKMKKILNEDKYYEIISFIGKVFKRCIELENSKQEYYVSYLTTHYPQLIHISYENLNYYLQNKPNDVPENIKKLYDLKVNECEQIYESHFITDSALSMMKDDLVRYYHENKKFPHILVIDNIMFYGQSLNNLLYNLNIDINNCYKNLYSNEFSLEEQKNLNDEYKKSLEIYVQVQNERNRLLLYEKNLNNSVGIKVPYNKVREYSDDFKSVIQNEIKNTSSWSSKISNINMIKNLNFKSNKFNFLKMTENTSENNLFVYLYPNKNDINAVCAVSQKTYLNENDNIEQILTPYIIFDHMNEKDIWNLHNKILSDIDDKKYSSLYNFISRKDEIIKQNIDVNIKDHHEWIVKTNELVLNALLLNNLFNEIKIDENEFINGINIQQLVQYYISLSSNIKDREILKKSLYEIWSWVKTVPLNKLEEYLSVIATKKIVDISTFGEINSPFISWNDTTELQKSYIQYGVENAVANISFERERCNFEKVSSKSIILPKDVAYESYNNFGTFLNLCSNCLDTYLKNLNFKTDIYSILIIINKLIEDGIITLNSIYDKHIYKNNLQYLNAVKEIFTAPIAKDDAQLIIIKRYQKFLSILEYLEKIRSEDYKSAETDIKLFIYYYFKSEIFKNDGSIEDATNLANNLSWLYKMICWSGNSVKDYDFIYNEIQNDETKKLELKQKQKEYKKLFGC